MIDLVERLREEATELLGAAWRRPDGGVDQCLSATLANEAADLIEELYEALQSLVGKDPLEIWDHDVRAARAILAKARGGQ